MLFRSYYRIWRLQFLIRRQSRPDIFFCKRVSTVYYKSMKRCKISMKCQKFTRYFSVCSQFDSWSVISGHKMVENWTSRGYFNVSLFSHSAISMSHTETSTSQHQNFNFSSWHMNRVLIVLNLINRIFLLYDIQFYWQRWIFTLVIKETFQCLGGKDDPVNGYMMMHDTTIQRMTIRRMLIERHFWLHRWLSDFIK